MKKITSLLWVLLICISIPNNLYAWGKKGHALVAEIGYTLLDSNTKLQVVKYLDGMSLSEAGNWMDNMRSDPRYEYMKQWHYVNIEKGNQYEETKEDNIINALNAAIGKLKNRQSLSDEEVKKNLLVVFHLVGDLHQPLHVGYGSDKGGNAIQVKYLDNSSNLHRVWDTDIIEGEKITINDCLLLYKNFDSAEIAQLKAINVERWIREPRSLLQNVYAIQDNNVIDQAYVDKNKKIIEQQLLIAGLRLSAVLEYVFKS